MFNEYLVQGNATRQYARILSLLLSLRQACDHPFLLLSRARGLLKRQDEEDLELALTQDMITKIYESAFREKDAADAYATSVMRELEKEKNIGQQVCPICCDPIGIHPVLTKCFHVFCESCIDLMAKQTGVLAFFHSITISIPSLVPRVAAATSVKISFAPTTTYSNTPKWTSTPSKCGIPAPKSISSSRRFDRFGIRFEPIPAPPPSSSETF